MKVNNIIGAVPYLALAYVLCLPLAHAESREMPVQRPGPTKEQTMKFIHARVEGASRLSYLSDDQGHRVEEVISIKLRDDNLIIKQKIEQRNNPSGPGKYFEWDGKKYEELDEWEIEIVIPLGRTTRVSFNNNVITISAEEKVLRKTITNHKLIYIYNDGAKRLIEQKSMKPSMEMQLRFAFKEVDDPEQLKKAFDHLRKLCGAQDPLSFD